MLRFRNDSVTRETFDSVTSAITHDLRTATMKTMVKVVMLIAVSFTGLSVQSQTPQTQIPKFIKVEGGTFTMGDKFGDGDEDETSHEVTLSTFYISQTEVTVGQYRTYCNATGGRLPWEYVDSPHDNEPVRFVNYNNAVKYCSWLSKHLGKKVTLPTEAQWEFAARGGNKSKGNKYAWGVSDPYDGHDEGSLHWVGKKQANELGLYDMSENVWEWCSDWYGAYPTKAQRDPGGPSTGTRRVIRGGSYVNDEAPYSRVSDRNTYMQNYNMNDVGFRVVRPVQIKRVSEESGRDSRE